MPRSGRPGAQRLRDGMASNSGIHVPAATHIPGAGTETTGAGDVFAAAMAVGYAKGMGVVEAAHDASEWAARSTTAPGWYGI